PRPCRRLGLIRNGNGIIKKHHNPIARKLVECAFELADKRPQSTVVFAQEIEDFLRLGSLSKGRVPPQVTKHDDDFTTMAFENLLIALRYDEFGKLRRQEPLQPPDPAPVRRPVREPAPASRGSIPQLLRCAGAVHRAAAHSP